MTKHLIFLPLFILFITGCAKKYTEFENISKANLKKVEISQLEGFENDDLDESFEVFKKACERSYRYGLLKEVCKKSKSSNNAKSFFTSNFDIYAIYSKDHSDKGLITGYYEPMLNGSRKKSGKYRYPVYEVPDDLLTVDLDEVYPKLKGLRLRGRIVGNKVVPYFKRDEIKNAKGLTPICYVDDDIDLFFLQIQGSGKVRLDSGEVINVGYSNQNGRKYYSIGRKLIEMKEISKEKVSLQSIKKWLKQNPDKKEEILNLNESYVFFRESKKGATGALGVELTAKRNLAVDRRYIPLGLPVFIQTLSPDTKEPMNRLMVAADVGGAIKGEIRADLFFGSGKKAEELAGIMKEEGRLYLFLPKEAIKRQ